MDDLAEYVMQATRFVVTTGPNTGDDDWTLAQQRIESVDDPTGATDVVIVHVPVVSATPYAVRVAARDKSGNLSGWSATARIQTDEDPDGPARPQRILVNAGMNVLGVRWGDIDAADFDRMEVEIRLAARAAFAGDDTHVPKLPPYPARAVGNWVRLSTKGTLIVITDLLNTSPEDPISYDLRLRSVDRSSNVLTGELDAVSGKPLSAKVTDPEAGWVTSVDDDGVTPITGSPTALPGSSLVWDEAILGDVFAGHINADWITTGTLRVGGPGHAASIEVFDSAGDLTGRWSTEGIEILDPSNPDYKMVIQESSLVIYDEAVPVVSLTPLGIDAASITFGSARGGHNLISNSSFEMGPFVSSVTTDSVWDTNTDWNAAGSRQGADVNVTTGPTSITMTTVT